MQKPFDVQPELESDEKLLWEGIPYQGLKFSPQDFFLIPFSIFWCGFIIVWMILALSAALSAPPETSGAVWVFPIFGMPFVFAGYFFLIGRFQFDIHRRKKLRYALTNNRAIIFKLGRNTSTRSFVLNRFSNLEVKEKKNGRGSIKFGNDGGSNWFTNPWAFWGLTPTGFEFEDIADVRSAYNLIRESQNRES